MKKTESYVDRGRRTGSDSVILYSTLQRFDQSASARVGECYSLRGTIHRYGERSGYDLPPLRVQQRQIRYACSRSRQQMEGRWWANANLSSRLRGKRLSSPLPTCGVENKKTRRKAWRTKVPPPAPHQRPTSTIIHMLNSLLFLFLAYQNR